MNVDPIYWLLPAGIMLVPLAAFAIILFFGKYIDKYCDKIAIIAMSVGFVLSLALVIFNAQDRGLQSQQQPIITTISWMNLAGVNLQMGFLVDNLSAFMSMVVTGLATLVLFYSMFYMHGDTMYRRYFGYMCFFCFTMLGIVFSNNLLMTFVFWELVGLGSYFLIGFWFYKPPVAKDHHYQELKASYATGIDERYLSPGHAQKKAFVMNRVGDFGFLCGIGIFITVFLAAADLPGFKDLALREGPLNFDKMYQAVNRDIFEQMTLLGLTGPQLLTLAGIFTFMGAMGKSAQFPLHTWLPDAMQGPTTGSSIIHAATMVAAGVYMVARIHPLLTDGSLFFVALIGALTAFLAATIALVQWDIKAVLAYSTISQLGYMMIGLGAGGYTAGVAHLFTHAIFKCMLFLCAGSVIHACHHLQDMNRMGGLRRKMPITYATMMIGTFAIAGFPLLSAFYSKDAILAASLARAMEMGGLHWLPIILGFITAGLTTFYMFRLCFMTFFGEPRDKHIYDHAHESPPIATIPLCILATLCLGFWWAGGFNLPLKTLYLPGLSMTIQGAHGPQTVGWLDALITSPVPAPHSEHHEHLHHTAHVIATVVSLLMFAIGVTMAFLMYIKRSINPDKLLEVAPLRHGFSLLSQLWFFDRLYQDGIVVLSKKFNWLAWKFDANIVDRWLVDVWALLVRAWGLGARWIDNKIVDAIVDLFGYVTWFFGRTTQLVQAGKIQFYVCVTFGVAAVVLLTLLLR
ncbi:MAG TPA: NADH-quinone oxidoreductase subunit L [Planctomycetota bacterium]|nr:NADH-quinone oxidoreductase subunit L [Planctomycetota bacterium]